MVSNNILAGHTNVQVGGSASATANPSNFIIQGSANDVANYARQGNDLVVQMKSGKVYTIRDFASQGWDFNNLIFAEGEKQALVDLSSAVSAAGDGIVESLISIQAIGAGVSSTALLGILGATAAAGAAIASSGDDDAVSETPVDPTNDEIPQILLVRDDELNVIAAGDPTNDTTPTFFGKHGTPGAAIEMRDANGVVLGTATVNGEGGWIITPSTALPEGTNNVSFVTIIDGIKSAPLSYSVIVDTEAPVVAVTSISSDTGQSSDGITSDNTLIFNGTADPEATVTVYIDGSPIGTTTADSNGAWSYDHTGVVLVDGSYSVTAVATDPAGNASNLSSAFSLEIDTAVAAPVVTSISNDTGQSSDGITSDNTLIFSGIADPEATVTVYIDGSPIGNTTADINGEWSYDHTGVVLVDGSYSITAVATDPAGNTSGPSATFDLEIDTAIAAPVVTSVSDDTGQSNDGITTDNTLIFNGTSEPEASITLYIDGSPIGNTTANINGEWSYDYSDIVLVDGSYSVRATATDSLGNVSNPSAAFDLVVDTVAEVPVITSISNDTGQANDGITSDNTIIFNGTSEPEASVTVYIDGSPIGSTTADINGEWSYDHTGVVLVDGSYSVRAVATDSVGNTSFPSDEFVLEIDSVQPTVVINGNGDTGEITFTFNSAIDPTSFDINDITIANGTITPSTLSTNDNIVWTVQVTADPGANSNVAITLAAGAVKSMSGADSQEAQNETSLDALFLSSTPLGADAANMDTSHAISASATFQFNTSFNDDISGWDVSNVTVTSYMFYSATAFNQDIGSWDVSNVTDMNSMFTGTTSFNQDISDWDVSSVTNMYFMFAGSAFDQSLAEWDISSVNNMGSMFTSSSISVESMDATLRGWARKIAAGEMTVQNGVYIGLGHYTDYTAMQYLTDHYGWIPDSGITVYSTSGGNMTDDPMDLSGMPEGWSIHGLGGNDTILGTNFDDWIAGGTGDDTLTGGTGVDTFHYGFSDAGNDTITDFTTGNGGDVIHVSDLLIGYQDLTDLPDFITAADDGSGGTTLTIDHDGSGIDTTLVTINLQGIAYSGTFLSDMISEGNLVVAVV